MKDYIKPKWKSRAEALIGERFGRLVVCSIESISGRYNYVCRCDCGNIVIKKKDKLNEKSSCGCLKERQTKEKAKLRMPRTRTYITWRGMVDRCCNKKNNNWKNYGGRGITVCDRWLSSFENFIADMGERPEGHTIDRINNNLGYSPDNCRWATNKEQQNNKRTNKIVSVLGEEMTLKMAAEKYSNYPMRVVNRVCSGWDIENAIALPFGTKLFHHESMLMYKDNLVPLSEVAKENNMTTSTLYGRLFICGWNLNDALTKPLHSKKGGNKTRPIISHIITDSGLYSFSTGVIMCERDAGRYMNSLEKHGFCEIIR